MLPVARGMPLATRTGNFSAVVASVDGALRDYTRFSSAARANEKEENWIPRIDRVRQIWCTTR